MNKLAIFAMSAVLSAAIFAQEASLPDSDVNLDTPEEKTVANDTQNRQFADWPAFFAIYEYPETPDLVGLRITIPYSTKQESVTGIDLGFWSRSQYFEGIQLNLIRNDVKDRGAGIQVGLYNSITQADALAIQVGLWNEAGYISGIQAGLVNVASDVSGIQAGVINRCEEMYGFQVGLVNIIRSAQFQFMPILNVGF